MTAIKQAIVIKALEASAAQITHDRAALYACHCHPVTNEVDALGAQGLAEYDAALSQIDAAPAALRGQADDWRAMVYAPTDGREVELLLRHPNWHYAEGDKKQQWEQIVCAKWIDFNGGGWTWHGMSGSPHGWREPKDAIAAEAKGHGNGLKNSI
jgi:hypothetical protein